MRIEVDTNRRWSDQVPLSSSKTGWFIVGTVFTCVMTLAAVVYLSIKMPNPQASIATVVGLATPILFGLLGAAVHGLSVNIDGKLTKLVDEKAQKERLIGTLQGMAENPEVTVVQTDKLKEG